MHRSLEMLIFYRYLISTPVACAFLACRIARTRLTINRRSEPIELRVRCIGAVCYTKLMYNGVPKYMYIFIVHFE